MPELKNHSRLSFTIDGNPTWDQVQFGLLQRIADATEAMSKNYVKLQHDADRYKKWWLDELARRKQVERLYKELRGVQTKPNVLAEGE